MTADILAGGIATNLGLEGDVDSDASDLRSGLTALLQEHVYLAGIAIDSAVGAGGDLEQPLPKAAVAALDANSVALSKAVGAAYPDAEEPFLESWRQHIGFFVDYTLGKATKDDAKVDAGQDRPRRLPHRLRPAHQLRRAGAAGRRRRRGAQAARAARSSPPSTPTSPAARTCSRCSPRLPGTCR